MRAPLVFVMVVCSGFPAAALDVGASVGGASVGAGASVGEGGANVGAGAGLGGVGAGVGAGIGSDGARAGGGASAGNATAGAGADVGSGGVNAGAGASAGGAAVGAGAGVGIGGANGGAGVGAAGIGAGASAGVGGVDGGARGASGSGAPGGAGVRNGFGASGGGTGSIGAIEPPRASRLGAAGEEMVLPPVLLPLQEGRGEARSALPRLRPLRSLVQIRPSARPIIAACRAALAEAATPYGAESVEVASTGSPRNSSDGGISAPVEARIVYSRSGQVQVRQARVTCQFNAAGQVIAAL
jgi:hypothetical protein